MLTKLAEQIKRDAAIVAFNEGGYRLTEDIGIRQPISPEQVVEYEDMTDEQKRIVDAGNTIAGSFPQGLSPDELMEWIRKNLF